MNFKRLATLALVCAGLTVAAQDNFSSTFEKINSEVQKNSQAYQNLKDATNKIGHRLTGSANGKKAEEYAYNLLKSYGLDVKYQPFEVESWDRKTLKVEIGNSLSNLKTVKAVTLAHSPVEANVSAEIIDVGNGLEADYEPLKDKVKGKIALIYLGVLPGSPKGTPSLHRSEKTAIATKYGAVGVIIINQVKGGVLLTGTASVTGKLIPIPAVCIGLEDGMNLKNEVKAAPQYARINMTNFSGLIKARNVIATIKGTSLPNEKIVVGGHLDSWDLATGAIDNGIGSFSVLDMARTFKKLGLKSKRTVEFVMFMGEEQGLLGSKAYVEAAKKNKSLDQIRFMLNYDMTNDPKGFSTTRDEMKNQFTNWGAQVAKIDTGFKNLFNVGAGLHSDHQPFMLEGVTTGGGAGGRLPNNSGPYYHSDGDGFHLVDEQGMKNTVRYSAMLTYALANTPVIPVKRFDDKSLKEFLEKNKLKEPLKIAGEWKWGD
ncbi:M20/M25/M40 family metallo-hydrolase [Pedobacter montanisoli]|uniref:Carboxypeptidase Q n=1 Tax=Pedobacter montanisoli TaxID=2923277 RepID=A0ABS9ZRY9_9SPHI|nr:M20/M25/M40 family metallo-hydrolase [Pedobacter montanisoli]MCJ0741288.1 M20/M25/M40 family metallo-hydrolase [Pedobacter montanisoli]